MPEPEPRQTSLFENLPPHNGTATSADAAKAIKPLLPSLEIRVLDFLTYRGQRGATIDEISQTLKIKTASVCPRIAKLRDEDHKICDSRKKRKTSSGCLATVWWLIYFSGLTVEMVKS